MVISDDEIDAKSLRGFGRGESANPGINADDQPRTGGGSMLDHLVLHAVAFADAMRHVEVGRTSAKLNGCLQDDNRGGAVDVVVPIDQDTFLAVDGGLNAIDRPPHARHELRRMK